MSDSEEFRNRANDVPDKWTLAWWHKQFGEVLVGYRGATHAINRAVALSEEFIDRQDKLLALIDTLQRDRDDDRAKIGELSARVERMAAFLNSKRTNGSTEL